MIEIRESVPTEHFDSIRDLMTAHWLETEGDVDGGPNPVIESYKVAEDMGFVVAYAAFDGELMVGYGVCFVSPHLHYRTLYGQHDVLFVHKDYRQTRVGLDLIRSLRNGAKAKGAKFMCWHAKPGSSFEKILQRSCKEEETIYREEF
jgi:predicted GNAT superfamily acetyltransferase